MTSYFLRERQRAAERRGVGAGGNALGFRPDAVPGFTGYTPGSMCVPPTRHTRLTERDPAARPAALRPLKPDGAPTK